MNLTGGMGDARQIRFRLVRLDRAGGGGRGGRGGGGGFRAANAEDDDGIDLSKPLMLSAYGEWTKKSGYYTLAPGAKPTPLIYDDAEVGRRDQGARKRIASCSRSRRSRWRPTGMASTTSFTSPTKVTNANPFIDEYAWGEGARRFQEQ